MSVPALATGDLHDGFRVIQVPDGIRPAGAYMVCRPAAAEIIPLVRVRYRVGGVDEWEVQRLDGAKPEIVAGRLPAQWRAQELAAEVWERLTGATR